jgi:hypothetical protein
VLTLATPVRWFPAYEQIARSERVRNRACRNCRDQMARKFSYYTLPLSRSEMALLRCL